MEFCALTAKYTHIEFLPSYFQIRPLALWSRKQISLTAVLVLKLQIPKEIIGMFRILAKILC
jgi:hypothetical protein